MERTERVRIGDREYERVGIGDLFVEVTAHNLDPIENGEPSIEDLVSRDIQERAKINIDTISTESSIDALAETYQGALTLVLSLRKAIYLKTGK